MAMHSFLNEMPAITHSDMTQKMPEAAAVREGVNSFLFDCSSSESLAMALASVIA
jgi:hypothetical protein